MNTSGSTNSAQKSGGSDGRLAVYGSLAPGRPNHRQLDGLAGHWIEGTVRGRLREHHWFRLHEFEASGYGRTVTAVSTAEGDLPASIYVLAVDSPADAYPHSDD